MAGFGDANDIKINVTLDTEAAIKSAQELKTAIESSLKVTEEQFNKVKQVANQLSSTLAALSKAEVSTNKNKLSKIVSDASQAAKLEVGIAEDVANKKAKAAQKAANLALEAEKARIRELETLARQEAEKEKTRRTQLLKDIAQLNKDRAVIRKTPRAELPSDLGGVSGAGKLVDAFKNTLAGLSVQFGNVNVGFGTFISNFKNLGVVGGSIAGLVAAVGAIQRLDKEIDRLASQANKVEGLATGFETLQKTVGQDPTKSIKALREATRGLVSDIDLYQRANQAVLLGVPTKVFNEAAAAAVKLGRAMGIDAAFGLESLSLGLGRQSRLYLDNLGIIVSAEEAYKNFAGSVGKSAQDLTDAEKKAAFFAESLRKIKERAEELPEPLDTVGIALQRLEAAQENANTKFSAAFNASKPLIEAYKEQAKIAEQNAIVNERFGLATAAVGSIFKVVANDIRSGLLFAKSGFSEFVGLFTDLSKEDQLKTLQSQIDSLSESTNRLREVRSRDGGLGPILTQRLADEEAALAAARKEAESLKLEIEKLRAEGNLGIKINVDTTEISTAQSDLQNFFSSLKQKTSELGGRVEVPGLKPAEVNEISKAYENLSLQQIQNKLTTEEFNAAYTELANTVSAKLQAATLGPLAEELKALEAASKMAGVGVDAYADKIGELRAKLAAVQKGAGLYGQTQEQLAKVLDKAGDSAKKTYQDIVAGQKKVNNESKKGLKAQERELAQFTANIARALERAIPEDVQKDLVDIFNEPQKDAVELAEKIQALGEKFLKAGGDIQAFIKEAGKLKDLKDALPNEPIFGSAEQTEATRKYNEELKQVQGSMINLRDLIYGAETDATTGKKKGGGFFGFDLGESFDSEMEAQLAGSVQDVLATAFQAGADGFTREDVPVIAQSIGAAAGAAIAAYFGLPPELGAQVGGILGSVVGESLSELGKDIKGTQERKQIDEYFAELFDGDRLAIVIQGQLVGLTGALDQATDQLIRDAQPRIARISDLVFEGLTPFAGNVAFGGEGFTNYFDTLATDIKASFEGVGIALGVLQGLSAEQARLIGIAISNNVGGSLQNLQVLIQQTGESFEDLAGAVLKSFRDAQLTIEEAYNALVQLQNIYEEGIPGAIGAYEEAITNLNNILQSDRPGQYAIDSLRDIGAEGAEAKKTFDSVIASLGGTFGYAADQQARLFEALRINGITSLEQLAKASDEQLLAILRNFEIIKENANAPLVTTPTVTSAPKSPTGSRGGGRNTEADNAKKLREEIQKLLRESTAYEEIVRKITSGELARVAAGAQIIKLQREIESALRRRNDLEKRYSEELAKGSKANKKALADLAADLDKVNERIKKFTEEATKSTREFKAINLEGVIPLIKSANMLGVVATQVGVSLEKASDVLIKGFLQGRLTLKELREEMERTEETLGPGIPNAVGAVTEAFQGLIDAGTQGGQFSVDAFRDIFAEFREKFQKEGSALREAERKQLEENLKAADRAFAQAVGPEASAAAKKTLDEAKKALEDFYAAAPAPDLADLRAQLNSVFGETEVNKFFQALGESGLSTFEDFEKAGTDSIVGILQKLQEIGFNFGDTSQAIIDANKELVEAEKVANAGLDPLQEAINLIKGLNEGAAQLPPVFGSTTTAIQNLNGPLTALRDGFNDILQKLAQLDGNEFKNDVVFNVRTVGEPGAQALVDIIFGDGSGTTTAVGGTTSGGNASDSNTSQIARLRKEIQRLQKKTSTRSTRERIASLRKKIVELGG
jgi:hypothetical protein